MKGMRIGFMIVIGLAAVSAAGQSDSLLASYASYPDDTNKINLLYEKGFALRNTDLPRAIDFARACYACADKVQNKHFLAKALNFTGILKSETGLQNEALADLQKALALRIETRDTLSQAIILNNLGNVYSEAGKTELALHCYERSLQVARSIRNERWMNGALFSMAELQTQMNRVAQAEGNFSTLIAWAQQKNDYEILGLCYKNMGICSLTKKDTLAAESYQQQALDVAEMTDDDILRADAMTALAQVYLMKKKLDNGIDLLKKALSICTKNQYRGGLMKVWKVLADAYAETGDHRSGFYFLQKHDSVLALPQVPLDDSLGRLWEEKKEGTVVLQQKSFSWADHIFECLIVAALALLFIFVLLNRRNEQKE